MKRSCLLLLMTTLILPSLAHADYSDYTTNECGVYAQKLERESNRLNNFEDEVIAPMVEEMRRLKKTINHIIKRPREIENRISKLEKEIGKLEIDIEANVKKIALLTKEAESFDAQNKQVAARKKRRKIGELERKNINKTSRIEQNSGKIEDFKEEAQEIISAHPPLPKLENELAQVEMQLADQEQIKIDLYENVRFYESALGMCRDFQQLRIECAREVRP